MSKPGKDFELMVERIQKILHSELTGKPDSPLPPIVTIERCRRLPDLDNPSDKKGREVDIALRYRLAGTHFLVIVECRDKSRAQGVQWIEEACGKMRSVGAHGAILVSRSGFTHSAVRKAHRWGISLIHYREVDKDDEVGGSYYNVPCRDEGRVVISEVILHSNGLEFPLCAETNKRLRLLFNDESKAWDFLLDVLRERDITVRPGRSELIPTDDWGLAFESESVVYPLCALTMIGEVEEQLPRQVETFLRLTPQGPRQLVICAEYHLHNGTARLYHIKSGEDAGPVVFQLS